MFIMLVKLQVKPELVGEFRDAIVKNAELSVQRDRGCVRFDVLQQKEDPTRWILYEVYDDEQAWVDHRAAAHFVAFKEVGDRAIVTREATKLTDVSVNVKSGV
jgi:quinol monooxygenase YgiN